ncbi:mitochondrial import receptor subunit tom20 [Turnera subulata]|uniref:Mitochondrial import receptor subunit tom20 n=1 Tax=Turnera subulata TaxID=218843 RepID=A0A9Q0GF99_9ROSI|nr:mitochondrial import receptor subunit tom20 [Turnera subulata]
MDQFTQEDFDRLLAMEHARKTAEITYAKDPYDANNLVKWGEALLELSQFQTVSDSKKMINEAISKLEESLMINPNKASALWSIGNANTSLGFLTPDFNEAQPHFTKARDYYQQAVDMDPANELYRKSMEVVEKAPQLHMEIHRQSQQNISGGAAPSNTRAAKKKKSSDLKYDICGWIILAVGIFAWVGMAKANLPPPPPPQTR